MNRETFDERTGYLISMRIAGFQFGFAFAVEGKAYIGHFQESFRGDVID